MTKKKEPTLTDSISPAKNQLTVLAIMIGVICLAVAVAMGLGGQSLNDNQRWLLLVFLLVFPFIGLVVCMYLILRHHRKLAVARHDEEFNWQVVLPERQKQKLNNEVSELAAILGIPPQQRGDLRSAYIMAEDLALRQIEQESKTPLVRHITINGAVFDGISLKENLVNCVNVTFLVRPTLPKERVDNFLKSAEHAGKSLKETRPGSKVRLILALVTQLDSEGESKLRHSLVEKFSKTPVDVDIRLMDFEGLQKVFAAD